MKSYEEIIMRTASLDWDIRSKYPTAYMKDVFGVTDEEDPKLKGLLIASSHCGGIRRLFDMLPKKYTDSMIRYISK
jgi:hypothetical protein